VKDIQTNAKREAVKDSKSGVRQSAAVWNYPIKAWFITLTFGP
jgi:hypothetical protein